MTQDMLKSPEIQALIREYHRRAMEQKRRLKLDEMAAISQQFGLE